MFTDATFVLGHFYPQRQYKMCVDFDPCNAIVPAKVSDGPGEVMVDILLLVPGTDIVVV